MDADRALKRLFTLRAQDLLVLTGDRGARVASRRSLEIAAVTRRPDLVMKLQRGSEQYLSHVEFEMRYRRGLELRVFEYAAALAAERGLPVASTVVVLQGPAPANLLHQERVRGRVTCWRRIRVVRLWRMSPAAAMRLGPGGAALVGLMGRRRLRVVERAARLIRETAPSRHYKDVATILRVLSEGRYTARELQRIVPDEVVMSSSLVAMVRRRSRAEGRAEGRAQGQAEGRLEASRSICLAAARQYHPGILPVVAPAVVAALDPTVLGEWTLAAPQLSDREFAALLRKGTGPDAPRPKTPSVRRRVARPARRVRSSRHR